MDPKFAVMVLDSDAEYRAAIKAIVLRLLPDAAVSETLDPAIGSDRSLRNRCNLVIADMNRPAMTGEKFIHAMQILPENERVKFVLMLSGENVKDTLTKGNVTYLGKPFTADKLARFLKVQILGMSPEALDKPAKTKIDVNFIKPFIEGTLHIIGTTSGVKVTKKEVFVRDATQTSGDISALVSMQSPKQKGSMAIAFDEKTFLEIASKMLGESHTTITPEIQDAAAELCNQIYGFARNKLNEQGHQIEPAIPQIRIDPHHAVNHLVKGPCMAVRFTTDAGSFCIEAALEV